MTDVRQKFWARPAPRRTAARAVIVTLSSVALVALGATAASARPVAANPPAPTGTIVENANGSVTVAASGTWTWDDGTKRGDFNGAIKGGCSGYTAVGWALAWGDKDDTGYALTYHGDTLRVGSVGNAAIGTTADRAVAYNTGTGLTGPCGTSNGAGAQTGQWTASHTYQDVNDLPSAPVCVVTYLLKHPKAGHGREYKVDKNKNNSFRKAVKAGNGAGYATSSACFSLDSLMTTPTLVTTSTNAQVGSAVTDSATLSATVKDQSGGSAGAAGTITFKLYGPTDTTCTSTPVFTSSAVTVNGNGTYGPVSYTPTQGAGSYRWIATYSGDAANNAVTELCGATGETSTLSAASKSSGSGTSTGTSSASGSSSNTASTTNASTSSSSSVPVDATPASALSTAPVSGATTVHTGEPWAGSRPYEMGVIAFGLCLMGLGFFERRRVLAVRHARHDASEA